MHSGSGPQKSVTTKPDLTNWSTPCERIRLHEGRLNATRLCKERILIPGACFLRGIASISVTGASRRAHSAQIICFIGSTYHKYLQYSLSVYAVRGSGLLFEKVVVLSIYASVTKKLEHQCLCIV